MPVPTSCLDTAHIRRSSSYSVPAGRRAATRQRLPRWPTTAPGMHGSSGVGAVALGPIPAANRPPPAARRLQLRLWAAPEPAVGPSGGGCRRGQASAQSSPGRARSGHSRQSSSACQSTPVQAGPGRVRSGHGSPARLARPGQARPGQAGSGQARPGQARPGQVRSGPVRSGQTDHRGHRRPLAPQRRDSVRQS